MSLLILLGIGIISALGVLAGLHLTVPAVVIVFALIVLFFAFGSKDLDSPGGEISLFISIGVLIFTVFLFIGLLISWYGTANFTNIMHDLRTFLFR